MCGFVGFVADQAIPAEDYEALINKMADTIFLRGPDDYGSWVSNPNNLALGFRRLAIQDISQAGHQPMHSFDERYTVCFNGEIYNHLEIRKSIEDKFPQLSWRSHSDTETILYAIHVWGIENALKLISGMFALAVWDDDLKTLTLARDRFGEKPLYYGWSGQSFIFGSQLKAFKVFPSFQNKVSKIALAKYLKFNYVPSPLSIYEDVFKLEPGCYIEITEKNIQDRDIHVIQYWSLQETISQSKKNVMLDENDVIKKLQLQLKKTISDQMLSDVPLGAFLSGGIDSSLIVSIMQEQSSQPIKTIPIGLEDQTYDESKHAKKIAEYLGTDHRELIVTAKDAQEVIKLLPDLYDEPFADSSQIPTYLVSKLAKQDVTVVLSGDAGDELFAGYNRYFWAPRIWKKISWLPHVARKVLANMIYFISADGWNKIGSFIAAISFGALAINRLGDKALKLADRLRSIATISDLYLSLVTEWDDTSFLLKDFSNPDIDNDLEGGALNGHEIKNFSLNDTEEMMYFDSITYLPDDILCKVDRASMGVSLEARVPFLDPKIAEIAWSINPNLKTKNGESKSVLRKILYTYVPKKLIERPKAGFGVPVGDWLRTDLKNWADNLLSEDRLKKDGIFHSGPIRKLWFEHLEGKRDWTPKLWSILMFQAWLHGGKK
jgi:asparagine synthase (glutamine-hydrolysing)